MLNFLLTPSSPYTNNREASSLNATGETDYQCFPTLHLPLLAPQAFHPGSTQHRSPYICVRPAAVPWAPRSPPSTPAQCYCPTHKLHAFRPRYTQHSSPNVCVPTSGSPSAPHSLTLTPPQAMSIPTNPSHRFTPSSPPTTRRLSQAPCATYRHQCYCAALRSHTSILRSYRVDLPGFIRLHIRTVSDFCSTMAGLLMPLEVPP